MYDVKQKCMLLKNTREKTLGTLILIYNKAKLIINTAILLYGDSPLLYDDKVYTYKEQSWHKKKMHVAKKFDT